MKKLTLAGLVLMFVFSAVLTTGCGRGTVRKRTVGFNDWNKTVAKHKRHKKYRPTKKILTGNPGGVKPYKIK